MSKPPPPTHEDELAALLRRWRGGDRSSGAALYLRCCEPVKRFFRNRVPTQEAADLVQETFAIGLAAAYRGDGTFRAFLLGVADNVFKAYLRRTGRAPALSSDEEFLSRAEVEFCADPAYIMGRVQSRRLMMKAIRRIPRMYQLVLELGEWEGLTRAEVAVVLDKPESTIRGWHVQARRALYAKMLELARSPDARKLSTMTVSTWRRWARTEAGYVPHTSRT